MISKNCCKLHFCSSLMRNFCPVPFPFDWKWSILLRSHFGEINALKNNVWETNTVKNGRYLQVNRVKFRQIKLNCPDIIDIKTRHEKWELNLILMFLFNVELSHTHEIESIDRKLWNTFFIIHKKLLWEHKIPQLWPTRTRASQLVAIVHVKRMQKNKLIIMNEEQNSDSAHASIV